MNWIDTLNSLPGRTRVGSFNAAILFWAHTPETADNRPHRHTFHEICLVGARGNGLFHADGVTHVLEPGTLFYAGPGVVHQIVNTSQPDMDLRWLCVHIEPGTGRSDSVETDQWLRAIVNHTVFVSTDTSGRIQRLWSVLEQEARSAHRDSDQPLLEILIHALILAIGRCIYGDDSIPSLQSRPGTARAVERISLQFIHDNLSNALTIADVAAQAHVSPRHLARVWKAFTGVSPAEYILQARMDRAASLLRKGESPIKQVAEQVGYDVHLFTRRFTAHFGVSPAKFRDHPDMRGVRNVQKHGDLS